MKKAGQEKPGLPFSSRFALRLDGPDDTPLQTVFDAFTKPELSKRGLDRESDDKLAEALALPELRANAG
jgi:hypothetical protein